MLSNNGCVSAAGTVFSGMMGTGHVASLYGDVLKHKIHTGFWKLIVQNV